MSNLQILGAVAALALLAWIVLAGDWEGSDE